MPPIEVTENEFLLLNSIADQLGNALQDPVRDEVGLPPERGGLTESKAIPLNELLMSTLSAIVRAKNKLRGQNLQIDMGSEPLEIKFTGKLAGFSRTDGTILIELEATE